MVRVYLILLIPLFLVAGLLALVRYCWSVAFSPDRAWRISKGWDQLGNVALNGSEDELISTRAARARDAGRRWGCVLCRLLDHIDPDHCDKSRWL